MNKNVITDILYYVYSTCDTLCLVILLFQHSVHSLFCHFILLYNLCYLHDIFYTKHCNKKQHLMSVSQREVQVFLKRFFLC